MVQVLAVVIALVSSIALVMWSLSLSPIHGLDFSVYRMGGQSVLRGDDLYTTSVMYSGGPLLFTYPPFAALLFTMIAPFGQFAGARLFLGFAVVIAVVLSTFLLRRLFRLGSVRDVVAHPWLRPLAIVGAGLILLLGPWRETSAFGQINILLMAAMLWDLLYRGQCWPIGFLTGVAAGIKLTPLVFGFYFLVRRDWAGLRNMVLGFFTTVGLGFLVLPRASVEYWTVLLPDTSRIGGGGYVDNLSLKGTILHFAGPDYDSTALWLLLSLATLALAGVVIKMADDDGARLAAVSATALLMLLVSPVSWSHHWVWAALFLPVHFLQVRQVPQRAVGLTAAGWILLAASVAVFFASPKKIGKLFGSEDLNSQIPELWLMASSAGVFCAVALLVYWLLVLRKIRRAAN
ncbi:hypothetical protein GCM10009611_17200 [Arthrobacter roseus]